MITKAIEKITKEVNDLKTDHAQILGEYLIDHISESSAACIVQDDKTLKKAIEQITGKAKGKAEHSVAMIEDKQVYAWLYEYYSITDQAATPQVILAPPDELAIDLMDLLD